MIEQDVLDAGLGDADDDDFDLDEAFDSQLPDNRYLDRELSWLAFNQRVLELAEDPFVPLLERANFLAIFASNLDEFFMVRVAGLKRRIVTGLAVPTNVGRSPQEVLADISAEAHRLQLRHADVWLNQVKPALAEAGISIVGWDELDDEERERLGDPPHLGPAPGPKRLDRDRPEARLLGQQPVERPVLGEAVVEQQHDRAAELLERLVLPQERRGHLEHAVDAPREQGALLDQPVHLGGLDAESLGDGGDVDPGGRVGLRHGSSVPQERPLAAPLATPQALISSNVSNL